MSELKSEGFIFDYWPTGSCDMVCPFCYGAQVPDFTKLMTDQMGEHRVKMYVPNENVIGLVKSDKPRPELNTYQSKQILELMSSVGADAVTIAGGEPLIREDTPELIQFAKRDLGMMVYLSTDGTYVLKKYDRFKGNIDVIGMPIDGSSHEMNLKMGRRGYLYKNIKSILEHFKEEKPDHLVKLGTVVSKINIDDVKEIGKFLFESPEQYRPDVWRLYQFESIGRGKENAEQYIIPNSDFEEVCSEMETRFPDVAIRPRSNEGNFNAYFFVTPDGILQTVNHSAHISVIDLLKTDTSTLRSMLGGFTETVERANQNRSWLNPQTLI